MNIAFFGSSLLSAYWNGAATYYRGIIRALHARGHHVTFYESDAYERQQHRDIPIPDWAKVVVYSAARTDELYRCLEAARHADLIVKASGNGVFDDLLEAAVLDLKTSRNLIAFWDVDAPATLDRVQSSLSNPKSQPLTQKSAAEIQTAPADPFAALIPRYDLILTYGGGEPVINAYKDLGARQCVPIYNALDPATHHPVAPEARFNADLGLLANRLPDREARIEAFFLEPASQLPDKQFLLGGNGWHDKSLPPNVNALGHVYTKDHNAFNCTPRAVLNVSRESMARYGFSPATRVFEAAGAGSCLISDDWLGIELFLEPETEVLVARDGQDVVEHLHALTPARAHAIGQAALCRVLAEHTYAHRAVELEKVLGVHHRPHSPVHPAFATAADSE